MGDSFQEKSYSRHAAEFHEYAHGQSMGDLAKTWFDTDTVDAWRHRRMYATVNPILENSPGSRWVTVGDGRYGNDAKYLSENGVSALATNISDVLLKEAFEAGYIAEYGEENAERLSFDDESFDYALCKEAYHHFPRPMIALYEMLRVTRKGIVLIEPNDSFIPSNFMAIVTRQLKAFVNFLLGKQHIKHEYEEAGNYVFRISRREIEKVALGLNFPVVAFRGMNDAYFPGVGEEKLVDKGPLWKRVRFLVGAKDILCNLRLMDHALLTAMIFKQPLSAEMVVSLKSNGFTVVNLPSNPHI